MYLQLLGLSLSSWPCLLTCSLPDLLLLSLMNLSYLPLKLYVGHISTTSSWSFHSTRLGKYFLTSLWLVCLFHQGVPPSMFPTSQSAYPYIPCQFLYFVQCVFPSSVLQCCQIQFHGHPYRFSASLRLLNIVDFLFSQYDLCELVHVF